MEITLVILGVALAALVDAGPGVGARRRSPGDRLDPVDTRSSEPGR